MTRLRYIVKKHRRGWGWRITARNGRVRANNETFTRKRDAVRALRSLVRDIQCDDGLSVEIEIVPL